MSLMQLFLWPVWQVQTVHHSGWDHQTHWREARHVLPAPVHSLLSNLSLPGKCETEEGERSGLIWTYQQSISTKHGCGSQSSQSGASLGKVFWWSRTRVHSSSINTVISQDWSQGGEQFLLWILHQKGSLQRPGHAQGSLCTNPSNQSRTWRSAIFRVQVLSRV